MAIIVTFILVLAGVFYAEWILRPAFIISFIELFPDFSWKYAGPWLLIVNLSLLATGVYLSQRLKSHSHALLPLGGLVASATVGLLLSLSFNFNLLWQAINQKYLVLIIIFVYGAVFIIPMLIYSIRGLENDAASPDYLMAQQISTTRRICARVEEAILRSGQSTSRIEVIRRQLGHDVNSVEQLREVMDRIYDEAKSSGAKEELLVEIAYVKSSLKGVLHG